MWVKFRIEDFDIEDFENNKWVDIQGFSKESACLEITTELKDVEFKKIKNSNKVTRVVVRRRFTGGMEIGLW